MKQFIKEHPWRLEIVSAIVTLIAVILPFAYHLPILDVDKPWLQARIALKLAMVGLWIAGFIRHHRWIIEERGRKIFNYSTLVWLVIMAIGGWLISNWQFMGLWIGIIFVSSTIQAFIEKNRQPVPLENKIEKVVKFEQGESFYYSETNPAFYWKIVENAILILFILPACWVMDIWIPVIIAIPFLIIGFNFSKVIFVVNNERISARFGLLRKHVPISQIKECSVTEYQPLDIREELKCKSLLWAPRSGSNLRVDTLDGKSYLLGFQNPETACKLINTVLVARGRRRRKDEDVY